MWNQILKNLLMVFFLLFLFFFSFFLTRVFLSFSHNSSFRFHSSYFCRISNSIHSHFVASILFFFYYYYYFFLYSLFGVFFFHLFLKLTFHCSVRIQNTGERKTNRDTQRDSKIQSKIQTTRARALDSGRK